MYQQSILGCENSHLHEVCMISHTAPDSVLLPSDYDDACRIIVVSFNWKLQEAGYFITHTLKQQIIGTCRLDLH